MFTRFFDNPLVSILIPVFNAARFIEETLESVRIQTYTNWECIIIDDHSTDNSQEIIDAYCSKHSEKFHLYTNPSKGACSARNHAFIKSHGDYIQYLDGDDLLSPNKLEAQLILIKQFGEYTIANCKWGRFIENVELVRWESQPNNKDFNYPIDWLTDSWLGKGMSANSSWLIPRHLIEKAGSWDENLQINQDGEFFCRVLVHTRKIKFSPDCGVYYRSGLMGSISQSNKQSRSKAESLLQSYKSYERVLSMADKSMVRRALGNNYLHFIYQFYSIFPDLALKAEQYFWQLGFDKMWPVGGKSFKRISRFVGFKNALRIKNLKNGK